MRRGRKDGRKKIGRYGTGTRGGEEGQGRKKERKKKSGAQGKKQLHRGAGVKKGRTALEEKEVV